MDTLSGNCTCVSPDSVLHCLDQNTCRCNTTGRPTLSKNCTSKQCSALSGPKHLSLQHDGQANLVQDLHLQTVFCTVWTKTLVVATRRTGQPCPRTAPPNSVLHCLDQNTCRCNTTGRPTLSKNCTSKQCSALSGPEHLSLQHDGQANLVQELHLQTVFCTVWTKTLVVATRRAGQSCPRTAPPNSVLHCLDQNTCRCNTTGRPTLSKNCTSKQCSALSGPKHLSLQHDGQANLVQELHLQTVFCTVWTKTLVVATRRAGQPCPRTAPPNGVLHCLDQNTCRCNTTGRPTLSKNCTSKRCSALSGPKHLSLQHDGQANLVQELHLQTVFCTVWTKTLVVATRRAGQPCPRTAPPNSVLHCLDQNTCPCNTTGRPTLSKNCTSKQCSALSGPKHLSLQHDGQANLVQELHLQTVFCTVWTKTLVVATRRAGQPCPRTAPPNSVLHCLDQNTCRCNTTGRPTLSKNGNRTVFGTVWASTPCRSTDGHTTAAPQLKCRRESIKYNCGTSTGKHCMDHTSHQSLHNNGHVNPIPKNCAVDFQTAAQFALCVPRRTSRKRRHQKHAITQEIAIITGRLDGAHHKRGRTCTTSTSSSAPRRNAGNSVWDGNYLGSAKAAHQGPNLPSPPPPHPKTPVPEGHQFWPTSQRHILEEAVADNRHEALLNLSCAKTLNFVLSSRKRR